MCDERSSEIDNALKKKKKVSIHSNSPNSKMAVTGLVVSNIVVAKVFYVKNYKYLQWIE